MQVRASKFFNVILFTRKAYCETSSHACYLSVTGWPFLLCLCTFQSISNVILSNVIVCKHMAPFRILLRPLDIFQNKEWCDVTLLIYIDKRAISYFQTENSVIVNNKSCVHPKYYVYKIALPHILTSWN